MVLFSIISIEIFSIISVFFQSLKYCKSPIKINWHKNEWLLSSGPKQASSEGTKPQIKIGYVAKLGKDLLPKIGC